MFPVSIVLLEAITLSLLIYLSLLYYHGAAGFAASRGTIVKESERYREWSAVEYRQQLKYLKEKYNVTAGAIICTDPDDERNALLRASCAGSCRRHPDLIGIAAVEKRVAWSDLRNVFHVLCDLLYALQEEIDSSPCPACAEALN